MDCSRTLILSVRGIFVKNILSSRLTARIVPALDALDVPNVIQNIESDLSDLNIRGRLDELPALAPLESLGLIAQGNIETSPALVNGADRVKPPKVEPREDIWQLSKDLPPIKEDIKYLTWQNFYNQTHHEISPMLLSETDPSIFDGAVDACGHDLNRKQKSGRAVQYETLLKSLCQLGLGQSSVLFPYAADKSTFTQALNDGRASGTTLSTSQSLIDDFTELGNAQVQLRKHVQKLYSSKSAGAGAIALAKVVLTVQDAIEAHLVERGGAVRSLVQLQVLFEKSKMLILLLKDLVDTVCMIKDEADIVSVVYNKLQQMEMADDLSHLATEIMRLTSQPWLAKLQDLIGLSYTPFVATAGKPFTPRTFTEDESSDASVKHDFPSFVEQQECDKIIETSEALQYLAENEPSHSLLAAPKTDKVQLEWGFGWQDIERISAKASAFKDSLLQTLHGVGGGQAKVKPSTIPAPSGIKKAISDDAWLSLDDPDQVFASIQALDMSPKHPTQSHSSSLHQAVAVALSPTQHQEHDSLRPTLSLSFHLSIKPLLAIQHQQLTTAALNSVMSQHSLRTHLNLLHAFPLCSSGIFTTRLASAIFDPDAELAERKKNTLRSGGTNMGLKLGSGERREWPPASSELRLALMNILTDCWRSDSASQNNGKNPTTTTASLSLATQAPQTFTTTTQLLPGDLSFALRTDLSATEIDRILDADSLYALDFLRLHYTPPPALRPIFTPSTLDIYDRVFRLLLRLLRVNFVLEQLFRDTVMVERGRQQTTTGSKTKKEERKNLIQMFRHRATFVVHTVTSQFIFAGIARPWKRMMRYLDNVDAFLLDPLADKRREVTFASLVKEHADTVEAIGSALLVKKRQVKAATVFEAVLSDVLDFARMVRDGGENGLGLEDMQRGYQRFNEHIRDFSAACGETLQRSSRNGGQKEAEECIQELVERLEENL